MDCTPEFDRLELTSGLKPILDEGWVTASRIVLLPPSDDERLHFMAEGGKP